MKKSLIKSIIEHLTKELEQLLTAANNAHLAATNEQSIAETQYDTLAIEAGYLAEGQSRRVQALTLEITELEALIIKTAKVTVNPEITSIGSLIEFSPDNKSTQYYFLVPAAAGFRGEINNITFTVITPLSPMGKALFSKGIGDEISITLGNVQLDGEIISIS